DSQGLFKSTNGGDTWTAINAGLTNLFISVVAIAPSTPSTLYAATGSGLFKSIDGGSSWSFITGEHIAYPLAVDPRTPSTLYAPVGNLGLGKSTDGGATWHLGLFNIGGGPAVTAMVIDPLTPDTLSAAGRGTECVA